MVDTGAAPSNRGASARRNFRFKSRRSILEKFRLKSGANRDDLCKAVKSAVDLYGHCTLVLFPVLRYPIVPQRYGTGT